MARTATAMSAAAVSIGSPASKDPRTEIQSKPTMAAITTRQPQPVTERR
jgi:hypothetical protein